MFWRFSSLKRLYVRSYNPLKALGRKSVIGAGKVRFIREQRIFAKGSKGPVKKRSTTVLRVLRLYVGSGSLQNVPPLSTLLNLFGVNVLKFCEDYNLRVKNQYLDLNIPLVLRLTILKDLSFSFFFEGLRLNYFLMGLRCDLMSLKMKIGESLDVISVDSLDYVNSRVFTIYDLWFMFIVLKLLALDFYAYSKLSPEIFLTTSRGFYSTLQGYKFKPVRLL